MKYKGQFMKKRMVSFTLVLTLVCSFSLVSPWLAPQAKAASDKAEGSASDFIRL
jgi:hypothetical protein